MVDDQTAVRDALSQLDAAFAQHDLAAVVDLCTEGVVFIGSGVDEEAVGRSGIEDMFAAIADRADGTEFALRWESVSAEIIGDLAILRAIGEATLNSPRRQAVTRYRLTGVLVRKADRWLWRVHHGSEPAAW